MAKAATAHLGDLAVVPCVERSQPASPAHRLGVIAVPALARREDGLDRVQLPVLAEEVSVAQRSGVEVPYAHRREGSGGPS